LLIDEVSNSKSGELFFGAIHYVLVKVRMEWMIMKITMFLGFLKDDSDMDV
jgi:hypothetical protein